MAVLRIYPAGVRVWIYPAGVRVWIYPAGVRVWIYPAGVLYAPRFMSLCWCMFACLAGKTNGLSSRLVFYFLWKII